MSLSLNCYGCLFTFFPALSICADTRVGNAIGRGAAVDAKRAMRVAAVLSIPAAMVVSLAPRVANVKLWLCIMLMILHEIFLWDNTDSDSNDDILMHISFVEESWF